MVLALNTVSGQIADISPKMLLHPKFKNILVPVDKTVEPPKKVSAEPEQEPALELPARAMGRKPRARVFEKQDAESHITIEEEN